MKITVIGPVYPYRGGIAHYTSHLAKKLVANGFDTQIISFQRQYPTWLYPGESDQDPSKQPLTVQAKYLLDPIYPWTWVRTEKVISQFNPQLIAVQWWTTFWSPSFAFLGWLLRMKQRKIIYVIHNVLPHEEKFWDRWFAKLALSAGNGFIVHTDPENDRLHRILPRAKTKVCPIPVYDSLAQSGLTKTEARKLLKLPERTPILLSFGIIRSYKGLSVLINAIGLLRQQGVDLFLLIAGEFWDDKSKYINQINELDLNNCIRIEDRYLPDEEVARIFSAADVLIAPYTGGTQSAVASWGLGFGIPMIVTDKVAVGISDHNQHLVTVIPSGDPILLAEAIDIFLQNLHAQQKYDQKLSTQTYGWNDLIDGLISFAIG
jgi:glycosyltransferase involved in cell wall biosynthesis